MSLLRECQKEAEILAGCMYLNIPFRISAKSISHIRKIRPDEELTNEVFDIACVSDAYGNGYRKCRK